MGAPSCPLLWHLPASGLNSKTRIDVFAQHLAGGAGGAEPWEQNPGGLPVVWVVPGGAEGTRD